MNHTIKSVVETMIQSYLQDNALELVDIEYVKEGKNRFLRVFVDKEGGIDIDDCGRLSEYLSDKLDQNDPIADPYFLEVSSPGAERPLKKVQDFERAVGKNVFVTTYEPIAGGKEFLGEFISFDGEQLVIQTRDKQRLIKVTVPYDKVASARLAIIL